MSWSFSNVAQTGRPYSRRGARAQAMPQNEGNTRASDVQEDLRSKNGLANKAIHICYWVEHKAYICV